MPMPRLVELREVGGANPPRRAVDDLRAGAALGERFGTELNPDFQPNDETLEGSFSSASKPIFAPKYAFCSIFGERQDLQSFAPLQFQNLS